MTIRRLHWEFLFAQFRSLWTYNYDGNIIIIFHPQQLNLGNFLLDDFLRVLEKTYFYRLWMKNINMVSCTNCEGFHYNYSDRFRHEYTKVLFLSRFMNDFLREWQTKNFWKSTSVVLCQILTNGTIDDWYKIEINNDLGQY